MDIRMIRAGVVIAVAALAGCSSGATAPPSPTQANINQDVLQFAVGTATLPNGATGMNVLATFRQPSGLSATLLNEPVLTGPFTLPAAGTSATSYGATIASGPGSAELNGTAPGCTSGAPCIAGSPQVAPGSPSGAILPTTFGEGGGVFSTGFAPFNSNTSGSYYGGYTPFAIPYYAAGTATIVPLGGPPAYDPEGTGRGTRGPNFSSKVLGVDEGISVFQGVAPKPGTYTLQAMIPANTGATTVKATTNFTGGTVLHAIPAPTITFNGNSATVAYTLPAGVTGAYVQVVDKGSLASDGSQAASCNGAPVYYTKWVTGSGTFTIDNTMSPAATTPATTASTSNAICTSADMSDPTATPPVVIAGDTVIANVIGFDYDHYDLTSNGKLNATYPQKPTLPATADISVSPQTTAVSP